MKKVLSVLAALAVLGGSATCFGAAAVYLNNYDVNGGNGNPVFYLTSGTAAGTGCFIEIQGGADAASLAPIASTGTGNPTVFALTQGFFDAGIGNLASGIADNANAHFKAIAWQGTGGVDDWKTAGFYAIAEWDQATGANTPPNIPSPATLNIPSMTIVAIPEPSIIALGLLGAAGLLIRRRK